MNDNAATMVRYQDIKVLDAFKNRSHFDGTHLATLRQALRNTGKLDPVTLWQEVNGEGCKTGRLVLLDGAYRLGAYRAEWEKRGEKPGGVPAKVFVGSPVEAELEALRANTKHGLPLTAPERTAAAWRLVRKHRNVISKANLAKASGVSERTIATMRKKLTDFDEAGTEPLEFWSRARRWPKEGEWTPPTNEERQAIVDTIAKGIHWALNRTKTKDVETIAEGVLKGLGDRKTRAVADYLFGGEDEDDLDLRTRSVPYEEDPDSDF